jgi:hypothetical protein
MAAGQPQLPGEKVAETVRYSRVLKVFQSRVSWQSERCLLMPDGSH